jgi:hypothetical protein
VFVVAVRSTYQLRRLECISGTAICRLSVIIFLPQGLLPAIFTTVVAVTPG